MTSIAIIHVDLTRGRFGHAVSLFDDLAGKSVLQHTIDRVARIVGIDEIVLMRPPDQSLEGHYEQPVGGPVVTTAARQLREADNWLDNVICAARKWSLTAWRGGIGGMTVYDELLPAHALLRVMQEKKAESLVALRGDWCYIDPAIATQQLELHRSAPEAMSLAFTQAPPGLSPLVIHRGALNDLTEHNATIANMLCYNPRKPAIDPVGKDVNVQVPASVRMQYRRFIYDTPRAMDHLQAIAAHLGEDLEQADAVAVTDASRWIETNEPWRQLERIPQQVNVELSPRRAVNGPIVPQHYLDLNRTDMTGETVSALLEQLRVAGKESSSPRNELGQAQAHAVRSGGSPSLHPGHPIVNSMNDMSLDDASDVCPALRSDTAVLFGGLGDPLLHDHWFKTLERSIDAGLLGVGIETDLLVDDETIDRLATLPLDVIAVRINADSQATYEKLMGVDGYGKVMDNLQHLFSARNGNRQRGEGFRGWVVPRMVKVSGNLSDLETFFERWMTIAGWAVVDRAKTGRGLIPDMSPVPMEAPSLFTASDSVPPREKQRLTVLSDGSVCLCGEDWLGRLPLGSLNDRGFGDLWRGATVLADVNKGDSCVCPSCCQWLEAHRQLLASA